MAGLDTNVLVRHLTQDDVAQARLAEELLATAAAHGEKLFVPATVALELEWVLRSRYRLDKPAVLRTFTALLETRELKFQDEPALENALHLYREHGADFAECLHVGACFSHGQAPLMTFDSEAARLPHAKRVSR
jgi:predicted nucleic-acid-binding protein